MHTDARTHTRATLSIKQQFIMTDCGDKCKNICANVEKLMTYYSCVFAINSHKLKREQINRLQKMYWVFWLGSQLVKLYFIFWLGILILGSIYFKEFGTEENKVKNVIIGFIFYSWLF